MIKQATTSLLDFIDGRAVIRRLVLAFTLWMTYYGVREAWAYAVLMGGEDKVGTAAVIAAVLVPISALQGWAFQQYVKGKAE